MAIPTPHIACSDPSLIAKTVLMPGDPLRAKFIADTYLTDVICFTSTRNILGFTGYYNGKRISVMGSGMGMPSIGIYSYELYNFYGVENIIRIGSAGSYDESLRIFDTVLVSAAVSESNYAKVAFGYRAHTMKPSKALNTKLSKAAEKLGYTGEKEVLYLEHMLVSHHGLPQFGAAKKPMTAEALCLWHIDTIDSKFRTLGEVLEETESETYTDAIGVLDRSKVWKI